MAIRTRQELGYQPSNNPEFAKSAERDVIEFVNDEGDVIFFISVTKEWVTETVEGYLGEEPDIEGHTFEYEKTTVEYGVPPQPIRWREV